MLIRALNGAPAPTGKGSAGPLSNSTKKDGGNIVHSVLLDKLAPTKGTCTCPQCVRQRGRLVDVSHHRQKKRDDCPHKFPPPADFMSEVTTVARTNIPTLHQSSAIASVKPMDRPAVNGCSHGSFVNSGIGSSDHRREFIPLDLLLVIWLITNGQLLVFRNNGKEIHREPQG